MYLHVLKLSLYLYSTFWHRKANAPAFSYSNLYKFLPVLYKSLDSYLVLLRQQEIGNVAFNPLDVFQYLFFDAVGIGMFHRDMHVMQEGSIGNTLYKELRFWLHEFALRRVFNPIRPYLPRDSDGRRAYEAYDKILSICSTILSDYKAERTEEEIAKDTSILGHIVRCPYPTEAERLEEMYGFIIAGYETTAVSLTWAVIEIARDPRVLAKLLLEIDAVEKSMQFNHQNTSTMPYLQAVINESMRLRPVAILLGRTAEVDMKYKEYIIPKGSNCSISMQALFRVGLQVSCIYMLLKLHPLLHASYMSAT